MPFEKGDREYPYPDPETLTLVVAHHGDWMISVTPMIFNDRILVTHRTNYPVGVDAGFCYDKGGSAVLNAMIWDFENEEIPPGAKKVAFNALPPIGER